jgi:hypothetical protein
VRSEALAMGKLLDASCESTRAKRRYKNIVFSCEDAAAPAVHADNRKKAVAAAKQFAALFAPNSEHCIVAHQEKDHAHAHLTISNWDKEKKVALDWDDNLVMHMHSLDWCTVPGVRSGAYLYTDRVSAKYPSGKKELQLVALVEASTASAANSLQAMVDNGGAEPYVYKGKHGVVFRGARVQLKSINFNLRKGGKKEAVALVDGKYVTVPHEAPENGPIAQQNRIFERRGVGRRLSLADFDKYLFDPQFDNRELTAAQREAVADLRAGRQPGDPEIVTLFAKQLNAHLVRSCVYRAPAPPKTEPIVAAVYERSALQWEKQPRWLWELTSDLSRAHAAAMGPGWEEFQRMSDALVRWERSQKETVVEFEEVPL